MNIRQRTALRPWFALTIVLLVLALASWMLLRQKLHDDLRIENQNSVHELRLIASFITNTLRAGRYQELEYLLREWGETNPDIVQLQLVAGNGFVLALYQRPGTSGQELALKSPISYSYRGQATLHLRADLAPVHQRHDRLVAQLAAIFAVFSGLLFLLAREIVVRRQAEAQLHQLNTNLEFRVAERTASLEAANRELEAFSYSVSHDLRAPLRSIDGFGLALLEDYGQVLEGEGKVYLQRLRANTQRMGELIDAMILLSRVARAEMKLDTVDLSALAEEVAAGLADPENPVEFVAEKNIVAQADPRLLKMALENLLGNAWKYSAKVARPQIAFGMREIDGKPAYFIRDNGAGFDMAYADKLFGAFQRLHAEVDFPGTGIGLATVRRIVQRHGGQVWAESAPGAGATFYFTLQ